MHTNKNRNSNEAEYHKMFIIKNKTVDQRQNKNKYTDRLCIKNRKMIHLLYNKELKKEIK